MPEDKQLFASTRTKYRARKEFTEALPDLTEKQRIYVESRLQGLNKSAAERAAGYPARSGRRCAEDSPAVQRALQAGWKAHTAELKLTKQDVIEGMMDAVKSADSSMDLRQAWREVGLLIGAYEPTRMEVHVRKEDLTMDKLLELKTADLVKMTYDGEYWVEPEEDTLDDQYSGMRQAVKRYDRGDGEEDVDASQDV